jgi:hypothetical protein
LLMGHPSFEAMITTIMFVNDKDMFLQQKQPQFWILVKKLWPLGTM